MFRPQAWVNDNAVDVDGAVEFDATAKLLRLPLDEIQTFRENNYESDDLASALPARMDHDGPFEVDVDINAWLEKLGLEGDREKLTAEQLQQLRDRFQVVPAKDVPKRKITVPVTFRGHVDVYVPAELPIDIAKELGAKLAVAQVLATVENEDNGECLESALDEFVNDTDMQFATAERHWEDSHVDGVGGDWHQTDLEPIIAEQFQGEPDPNASA